MRAVILAGGLGTRLRAAVPDQPKCLAPVAGRPFIDLVLERLATHGVAETVLAVGYLHEAVVAHVGDRWGTMRVHYAVETHPLGTGGAIRNALARLAPGPTLVLNGDTWLELDYAAMMAAHVSAGARVSIAVIGIDDTARFGAVHLDHAGRVTGFSEKGRTGAGLINGGAYVVQSDLFDAFLLPEAFSFETDFLRPFLDVLRPLAFETRGAFIDIGVPESWQEAQHLLGPR